MHRLACAFAGRLCSTCHNLMSWLNRNVMGVPQSQAAANSRHQEEEKMTKTNKYQTYKQMHEKHKDQLSLPQVRW